MKTLSLVLVILIVSSFPMAASAGPCQTQGGSVGACVIQLYRWALGLSAILAMLMMVLGGYKVMTAGGNAEQSTSGKSYIMSAVVGIGLLLGAYLILNTINPDLVKFKANPFDKLQNPPPPPPRQ